MVALTNIGTAVTGTSSEEKEFSNDGFFHTTRARSHAHTDRPGWRGRLVGSWVGIVGSWGLRRRLGVRSRWLWGSIGSWGLRRARALRRHLHVAPLWRPGSRGRLGRRARTRSHRGRLVPWCRGLRGTLRSIGGGRGVAGGVVFIHILSFRLTTPGRETRGGIYNYTQREGEKGGNLRAE